MTALGHEVCYYRPGQTYDLVLVFNQVAHNTGYQYPHFPDERMPIAFIDAAEYGYFKRLPGVVGQYGTAFAQGSMASDTKNRHEQIRLKSFLDGRSFPYFLREFSKYLTFPAGYHPIDYPLYLHSECHARPDREEYLRRGLELFCNWGISHPWRANITQALRDAHRKAEIGDRWEDGGNLPQSHYFERMRAAKCSVSYDGYGSGSFRMTEVLCRTLLLQGPLSIVTHAPLVDGETCRTYAVHSDGEEFAGTDVGYVLAEAMADAEGSFEIYQRGFEHVHAHLTETATARYVLETVQAHDWTKPTPLTV